MKLNANPESRHFWLLGDRKPVDCFVDGVKCPNVYEADDLEGYAVVYVVEDDRVVVDRRTGVPVLKWLKGKVEFRPWG
jgi:hypothetical protein